MTEADRPKPARGRPRSGKSTEAILAAARELLHETGYTRLTIEAVAARSGAGKATIYRWWPTKGELILEAARAEISIGTVPDHGNLRDDLSAAIRQLVETFSRPLASAVIFAAISPSDTDLPMAANFRDRHVYPWRVSAAEAIRRGIARGELDASTDIQFVLDVIVGTVFQRTLVMKEPAVEGLVDKLLALVLPEA